MIKRALFLAFASALIVVSIAPATASTLEDDLAEVRSQISELERQASGVESDRTPILEAAVAAQAELDSAQQELDATQAEHDAAAETLETVEAELGTVRAELDIRFAHLEVLRGEVEESRAAAESLVIGAYKRGGLAEPSIAFTAGAFTDISVGVVYLELLTGVKTDAADAFQKSVDAEAAEERKIREIEARLATEADRLVRVTAEFQATLAELDEQRAVLAARAAQQDARLAEINREIDHFDNEISALEREEASIKAEITAASAPAPSPTPSGSGVLIRPVPGAVSSGFGPRIHPIYGTSKMHNGVDMNAAHGDPIKAAGSGTVILSGVKGGYGNTVMIDHGGGMVTLYAHQSQLGVSVGESVSRGQVIGQIGSTGTSTAPHLHFEVRINGSPRNPVSYW